MALLQVWAGREVTVFDVLVPGIGEALVFGEKIDKTLQNADWGVRPLPEEHLRYAAGDTTWCARLRTALEALERPPAPEKDDPEAIDAAFPEAKLRELGANAEMKALRESVRALMRREDMRRFSRFATSDSERLEVSLRAFVTEVERMDPARMLEFETRVTSEKLDLLNGGADRVLEKCRTWQSTRFRTPRLSRPRDEKHAPGPVSRAIDVRDALRLAPSWADSMVPLTKSLQLAIGEDAVAALAPAANTK